VIPKLTLHVACQWTEFEEYEFEEHVTLTTRPRPFQGWFANLCSGVAIGQSPGAPEFQAKKI